MAAATASMPLVDQGDPDGQIERAAIGAERASLEDATGDASSNLLGAAVGFVIGGPPGAAVGAVVGPFAVFGTRRALLAISRARTERELEVLRTAASAAGTSVMDLTARIKALPAGEDLLLLTLSAAGASANTDRLIGLASALVAALHGGVEETVAFETLFVRAIAECDAAHVLLLQSFVRTTNALGLGDGVNPDFDRPAEELGENQLALVHPALERLIPPLMGVLVRHGLVASVNASGGATFGGGGVRTPTRWKITEFGRTFLARLELVGRVTASRPPTL